MRRWVWPAVLVVIGAAAYVMVGDVRAVGARLSGFAWGGFALAIGLALANYAVRFVRWQMYLRRQDVSVPAGTSALIFGAGLSLAITPGKVGELVKSFLLREQYGIPVRKTAPIVVAERVTDLLALLVLALIGVAVYGVERMLVIAGASAVGFGLLLLAWPTLTRGLIDRVTRPRRLARYREPLHHVYDGLASLCRPRLLLAATALALPAWAAECIGFAAIVNGFPGAHVELGLAMVIYAATTIAGALSFLPGGLGVTEGAMTILLVRSAASLDRPVALDATLLTRLATLWFAVALGLVCLAFARRRIAAAARARAAAGSPDPTQAHAPATAPERAPPT